VLENYYRLERLELETEGILQLEVVSTDPVAHPIPAFQLPHEDKYVVDSYVITVNVKDGQFHNISFFHVIFSIFFSDFFRFKALTYFIIHHCIHL